MLPAYIPMSGQGLLAPRAHAALALMRSCRLCPRGCGVNRLEGELGACGVGRLARVASYAPHFGEESCLVGQGGSGAIFFSGCNLGCLFCQNEDISRHPESGEEVTPRELADIMLSLQAQGAANINLVTPSHVAAQVLEALPLAVQDGLSLPLVYNSGGYDSLETLTLLKGVGDIYMPDLKFADPETSRDLCGVADYPATARRAVKAMHAQVGDLRLDSHGLATRGLLVRHLVLPGGLAGTRDCMEYLAREISPNTYVNLMDQYRPCATASGNPPLDRPLSPEEFGEARQQAEQAGITRFDERTPAQIERLLRVFLDSGRQ